MKILIAEDSITMQRVISEHLNRSNLGELDITLASNGFEAIETFDKKKFDLILTDHNMPSVTGVEFITHIRKTDKKTPIIMITTEGSKNSVINALKAGATNYIVKPFYRETLIAKITEVLKR